MAMSEPIWVHAHTTNQQPHVNLKHTTKACDVHKFPYDQEKV